MVRRCAEENAANRQRRCHSHTWASNVVLAVAALLACVCLATVCFQLTDGRQNLPAELPIKPRDGYVVDGVLPQSRAQVRAFQRSTTEVLTNAQLLDLEHVVVYNGTVELQAASPEMKNFVEGQAFMLAQVHYIFPSGNGQPTPESRVPMMVQAENRSTGSCATLRNEISIFFSFHRPDNMYHIMNDNILPIAANILLHPACNLSFQCSHPVVLYTLATDSNRLRNRLQFFMPAVSALVSEVRPAQHILSGGPHCIRFLTWGQAVPALLLDAPLQHQLTLALRPRVLAHLGLDPALARLRADGASPVLLFMKRPHREGLGRFLIGENLANVERAGEARGASVVQCCNWRLPLHVLFEVLANASGLVGPHGAGLANIQFARQGAVLVNFMDSETSRRDWGRAFVKMAAAVAGPAVIVRSDRTLRGKGIAVSPSTAGKAMDCALGLIRAGSGSGQCGGSPSVQGWTVEEGRKYGAQGMTRMAQYSVHQYSVGQEDRQGSSSSSRCQ